MSSDPKKCKTGKACSSACIDPDKKCRVSLNPELSGSFPKIVSIVQYKGEDRIRVDEPKGLASRAFGRQIKAAGAAKENLSKNEWNAIRGYTQSPPDIPNYRLINGALRSKNPLGKAAIYPLIKDIDSGLAKLPGNEQRDPHFRGMNFGKDEKMFNVFANLKPGDKLTDPGYGSYAGGEMKADPFLGNKGLRVMLVSRHPDLKGVSQVSKYMQEQEFVLPRGTEQTVTNVVRLGDVVYVELE